MRKNHSKIVCIKLVHLPYLTTFLLTTRSYLVLLKSICLMNTQSFMGITLSEFIS